MTIISMLRDKFTGSNSTEGIQPDAQPSVAITTIMKNPRMDAVTLDTSGPSDVISGVFKIDIENTGILPTRSTRVTSVNITLVKKDKSLNIGKIEEPKRIGSIPAGETRTLKIEFERDDTFVKSVAQDICEVGKVQADMKITMAEIILAATYQKQDTIDVNTADCSTVTLTITGQSDVNVGQSYRWRVEKSGEGSVGNIQWNLGDGSTKTGQAIRHSYANEGEYTIEVQSGKGYTDTFTVNATVLPIGIVGPVDLIVGQEYTWNATGEDVDGVESLDWNMGDGSSKSGENVSHVYDRVGEYTIQLNGVGAGSATSDVSVQYPNVTIDNVSSPDSLQTNSQYTFSVTGDNISKATTVEWDMDDGTVLEGEQVQHTYSTSGSYEITVRAKVNGETLDSDSKEVSVETFAI